MTVPFSPRISGPYAATAGQTVFNYGWLLQNAAEATVQRRRDGVVETLELTTDYVVTGVGNALGGTIVLTAGAEAGDELVIYGSAVPERLTNFPGFRSIPDNAVDTEINRCIILLQEMRRQVAAGLTTSAFGGNAFDARGLKISNGADATEPQDFVTYSQLQEALVGSGGLGNPSFDISGLDTITGLDPRGDFLLVYDESLEKPCKITPASLLTGLTGSISAADYLANGDDATSDTTALRAAAAAATAAGKTLVIPAGTYLTDPIETTGPLRVEAHGATLKLRDNATPVGTRLGVFIVRTPGFAFVGGTIDANRAGQSVAAYNAAGGSANRQWFGIDIAGTLATPLTDITIACTIKNATDWGLVLEYCQDIDIDVDVETSGAGAWLIRSKDGIIRRVGLNAIDNAGALQFPHAFDIHACEDISGGNVMLLEQSGYNTVASGLSRSDWFTAFTFTSNRRVVLDNLTARAKRDGLMTKSVGASLLDNDECQFSNLTVTGYTSVLLEWGGNNRTSVNGFLLDGEYATSSLFPSEAQNGVHLLNAGYYSDFLSRALQPNSESQLTNGTIIRCRNPAIFAAGQSGCDVAHVVAHGNLCGVNLQIRDFSESWVTPTVRSGRANRFTACDFSFNERHGIEDNGSIDVVFEACTARNNGQAITAPGQALRKGGTFTGPSAGYIGIDGPVVTDRIRPRLLGFAAYDDQTIVDAKGSVNPDAPTVISLWQPDIYRVGQTVELDGAGSGGAALRTQILDLNRDEATIAHPVQTVPAVSGTGTISTNGTALTGSGTAFGTEIDGRTWIRNGGNYRRVVKVSSDAGGTLEAAFPANLSGAAFEIVRFNVKHVRSQDYAVRTTNASRDTGIQISDFNAGVGNVLGSFSLVSGGPIAGAVADVGDRLQIGSLSVRNGTRSLLLGANTGSVGLTDANEKTGSVAAVHYTNAEEPVSIVTAVSQAATSILRWGGGRADENAAVLQEWYAAANNTTTTGSLICWADINGFTVETGRRLTVPGSSGFRVGASDPFADAAGVLTLQNVDALDATTEGTIEAAIDTLPNLTGIGSYAFTLLGDFIRVGAHSLTLRTRAATDLTLPTSGTLVAFEAGSSVATSDVPANTSENIVVTIPIPAGCIGANGRVRLYFGGFTTNGAGTKNWRVRYGASGAGLGGTELLNFQYTTAASQIVETGFGNVNSQSSQKSFNGLSGPSTSFGGTGASFATAAINTANATEIVITGQKGTSGDTMRIEWWFVEVLYKA